MFQLINGLSAIVVALTFSPAVAVAQSYKHFLAEEELVIPKGYVPTAIPSPAEYLKASRRNSIAFVNSSNKGIILRPDGKAFGVIGGSAYRTQDAKLVSIKGEQICIEYPKWHYKETGEKTVECMTLYSNGEDYRCLSSFPNMPHSARAHGRRVLWECSIKALNR
ncbi:hypothetical protein [Pseudooceanicola sp.]|uniref:hypothetical protein n=1 Tax=Pseudooceanicola sp. TaxID=1914328 RepID=UPI0035C66692